MRSTCVILLSVLSALAGDKKLPIGLNSDDTVEIAGVIHVDKDDIKQLLGNVDMTGLEDIVVVEMTVRPLTEKPLVVDRDEFMLISDKDGQRAQPFDASQIAGGATLRVKPIYASAGTLGENSGPRIGGIPGMGRVRQLPGNGGGVGGGAVASGTAEATVTDDGKTKDSPLMAALRQKILPEKSITEPVSGLLYFQIDGKVKPKNLELFYHRRGTDSLGMRFPPTAR